MRVLIRADGTKQEFAEPQTMTQICELIDAPVLDSVALRSMGAPLHVMLVDDGGWDTATELRDGETHLVPKTPRRPINAIATALYLAQCAPGTDHMIAGDVFVCPDADFGSEP